MNNKKKNYLFENVSALKGVGIKLTKYLKNKKIENIKDLLWNFPYSFTDRSEETSLDKLEIGKISTVKVLVKKYNFPRIRNLPNKINCEDKNGKIDIIFFNSREGYIRKILPLESWILISGKISFFKGKYQITNPDYVANALNQDYVKKIIPKYSLTEGINEKLYRKIIEQVLKNLPFFNDWHNSLFLKKMNFFNWRKSIMKLHEVNEKIDINSNVYRRIAYDEIFAHLLVLSENRKKIKKTKKNPKSLQGKLEISVLNSLEFNLTNSQKIVNSEIKNDLLSGQKMFRILQGDVGSGKTIVSFLAAVNTIESGYQCALMAPTEILATQHYNLAMNLFKTFKEINIELITGKTEYKKKN